LADAFSGTTWIPAGCSRTVLAKRGRQGGPNDGDLQTNSKKLAASYVFVQDEMHATPSPQSGEPMQFGSIPNWVLTAVLTLTVPSRAADVSATTRPATLRIDDPAGATFSRRIIFLCDVSESMKTNMPTLQRELGRAINGLKPIQAFDILLMGQGEPVLFAPTYVGGKPAQKKLARDFLDKTTAGGPRGTLPAIDLAIRSKPDLLYLLVDRDFSADAVRDRLRETNADHKLRVNVIVLAASTEEGADKFAHLKRIAEENGGTFRKMYTDSPLFGDPGGARRIAYVSDVSLGSSFALKREICRAIASLPSTAEFSVLIASGDKGEAIPNDATLLSATVENQRKVEEFLDAIPIGASDPTGSIALAFSKKPDLICLVADGDFPDNAAVIAKIAALNKDKNVKINTVAYRSQGDEETAWFQTLKKIAKDNGGMFRIVKWDEL
jgi:hypothetical protein